MQLDLYHLQECPYSAKVRAFIQDHDLGGKISLHEIEQEPGALQRLERLSGSHQVPCLVIDGKPLLESDKIVAFLEKNLVKESQARAS